MTAAAACQRFNVWQLTLLTGPQYIKTAQSSHPLAPAYAADCDNDGNRLGYLLCIAESAALTLATSIVTSPT